MQKIKTEWDPYRERMKEYWYDEIEDKISVKYTDYGADHVIEANKREANESMNSHFYGDSKRMFKYASVPLTVVYDWMKEGLDVFSPDPDMQRRVIRKLEDPDYKFFKTTEASLARVRGRNRGNKQLQ